LRQRQTGEIHPISKQVKIYRPKKCSVPLSLCPSVPLSLCPSVSGSTFNALGQATHRTGLDPDGAGPELAPVTQFQYDALGNLISQTDPLGNVNTFVYDSLNKRTSTTDALSGTTAFTFNDSGDLLSLTDPENNTSSWTYDAIGRMTSDTNERGDARSFQYDAVGNLTRQTDRNGRIIQFAYDNLHQMNEESWYDGTTLLETRDFRYDQAGRMTSVNSNELVLTFDYDDLDRRTRVIHDYLTLTAMPYLTTLSEFDLNDRRTQVSTILTMTADSVTDYSYDALDRMIGIQQTGVTGGNAVADKRIDLAYNAANQFSTISRYEDLTATTLVAASDYSLDNAGRLTGLTHSQPGSVLADYGWTFDTGGRLTQSTSLTNGIVDYTHDDTHQLTAATYTTTAGQTTPPANESYTFDANRNRDDASTSIGTDNRLLSDGTYQYQYDAEGNRTKKTHIASGEETTYAWDFHNNLIEVTEKDAAGVTVKTVRYGYDGLDHKIWKEVTDALGTRTEVYAYDGPRGENGRAGDSMILRFDGAGEITNRYLHGPAVDQILADEQVTSASTAGNVLWPLTDHLATVRDVAEHDTVTGITTIANHIVYDSFGNRISETNAAVDTLFGYTGREWDSDIDLQHNRARWYDPATGNWISKDPIGFAAGDANLYRYVGNGPATKFDPSGLWWWDDDWIELGLGGLLGFQGQNVLEGAGTSIVENPGRDVLDAMSYVDPTPLSGGVNSVLTGAIEGENPWVIAGNVGLEFLPGPSPNKGCRVVGAIDDVPMKNVFTNTDVPVNLGRPPGPGTSGGFEGTHVTTENLSDPSVLPTFATNTIPGNIKPLASEIEVPGSALRPDPTMGNHGTYWIPPNTPVASVVNEWNVIINDNVMPNTIDIKPRP